MHRTGRGGPSAVTVSRTPSPTRGGEELLLAVTQELMPGWGWGGRFSLSRLGSAVKEETERPLNRDVRALGRDTAPPPPPRFLRTCWAHSLPLQVWPSSFTTPYWKDDACPTSEMRRLRVTKALGFAQDHPRWDWYLRPPDHIPSAGESPQSPRRAELRTRGRSRGG